MQAEATYPFAMNAIQKVLVVDDEPDVIDMVSMALRNSGFGIVSAENGSDAISLARSENPALIVLDLMLPRLSGLEVTKTLKNDTVTQPIPIIMLTAKGEEVDRIVGLELGADDYVTKPFSPRELTLRVKSVLRRGASTNGKSAPIAFEDIMKVGNLSLDHSKHEVRLGEKRVPLTATEFKLLALLMERRGRVQGRDRLLNDVWGYESVIDTRTVDTHVRRLREKLGKYSVYIETVRGVGYRISEKMET
ncbi:MAG: response regulator [Verrucomicrobiota bacterium]